MKTLIEIVQETKQEHRTRTSYGHRVLAIAAAFVLMVCALPMLAQNRGVQGTVSEDANANGVRDSADTPLPGWRIVVVDTAAHRVVAETRTEANGRYSAAIPDTKVTTVTVSAETPDGWTQVSPTSVVQRVDLRASPFSADFLFYHEAVEYPKLPPCKSLYWYWDCKEVLLTAGTQDEFSSLVRDPAATPSTQYQQYLTGRGLNYITQFDYTGQDRVFAHTFTIPQCPNGEQRRIVSARLTIRLRGNGGLDNNDALTIMDVTNASTPTSVWGSYLNALNGGTWSSTPQTFVWDLAAMPTGSNPGNPTNILSTLQDGALDIFLQDDSGIDFMTLDVVYCCLVPAPGDCIVEPNVDTNCCNYHFLLNNNSLSPITKIDYSITGGTVNYIAASGCVSTVVPATATTGSVNYLPSCSNTSIPVQISTTPDASNGTGWISLTLKVYHQNGGISIITQRFKCRRAPLSRCDELKWSLYSFDPNNISGRTFTVLNQKLPISPITYIGVRFTPALRPLDNQPLVVNGGTLTVNGGPSGNTWGPVPYYAQRIPNAPQTLTPSATNAVSFWLGIDRLQQWNGVVEFTVHHADGDSCTLTSSWKTTPLIVQDAGDIRAKLPRLTDQQLRASVIEFSPTTDSGQVGWVVVELGAAAGNDAFFSVTGSTLTQDGAEDTGGDRPVGLQSYQSTRRTILKVDVPFHAEEKSSPDSIRVPFVLAMDTSGARRTTELVVTLFTTEGQACGKATITLDSNNSSAITGGPTPIASVTVGHVGLDEGRISIVPNPVRNECDVTFSLKQRDDVTIEVYDLEGKSVAVSRRGVLESGEHTFTLSTVAMASGTYYVRVTGAHGTLTRLMQVVR